MADIRGVGKPITYSDQNPVAEWVETTLYMNRDHLKHEPRNDEERVRLAYLAAIALRRLGTIGYMLPVLLDPSKHSEAEQAIGCSLETWGNHIAEAGGFIDILTKETRQLINESGAVN